MNYNRNQVKREREVESGAIHIISGNGFDVRNKKTGQGHFEYPSAK